ncbi:MAG: tetratricopeptide repeat protein [Acidobacteriota bacterium]|nr:tetratricopeptide repeat protein [Acidobacteriota bacterium]
MRLLSVPALLICTLLPALCSSAQTDGLSNDDPHSRMHDTEQWRLIVDHLPDPRTATPQMLELQADILRARRFPEDAMDYYNYALARGGNVPHLLNKLGLTELEVRNIVLARAYFQRAVKLNKKDAEAWNNLGAVEYLDGASSSAISDYRKATRLDKHQGVFHANLATAYFEKKDYESARQEIALALKLDPEVFERRGTDAGIAAHVLSSADRARFSFEMAKMYARSGMEEPMLHSLAMASEAGMDVQREMRSDPLLAKLATDPRVLVLVRNAQALRASRGSGVAPTLPQSKPVSE